MKTYKGLLESGFTLIEIMIVVAIIAILASIAFPAYSDYVIKAKIPEATAMLASKRIQMEQYFQDNRAYDLTADACAANPSTTYFNYSCSVDGTTYTITAQGKNTMAGFEYTINQSNVKTSKIESPAKTNWQTAVQNCWVISKGQVCD